MLEEFAKKNASKVRFCYLPFPLPMHANAIPAGAGGAVGPRPGQVLGDARRALRQPGEPLARGAAGASPSTVGLPGDKLPEVLKGGHLQGGAGRLPRQGKRAPASTAPPPSSSTGAAYELALEHGLLAHSLEDELEWRANNNAWAAD